MRSRLCTAVVTAVLIGAASRDRTSHASTHTTGHAATVGTVKFVSSQGQPANEAKQMSNRC
jgi:hypothetical protein